ncbi:hypothetical protein BGZ96_004705 [Linnemannia gamsii]|uniref:N-acetyltransferase domain-containing protein n=1 Tax=Linnemannia gamsii TaxID=64522 RepID=A0ABQ7K6Q3_9FUNG|nr:hypothetical protein BGZ96_004705 [Linnemannia gamsii]
MTVEIPSVQKAQRSERIDIGDGLVMRWSTRDDADNIADCMALAFRWSAIGEPVAEDEDPAPNPWVKAAVKRVLSGNCPVMTEFDYAVVENTLSMNGQNPIVACASLHGVPGFYGEKVSMLFGKPEAISSHPDYRSKGLIRKLLFELIHPASAARGDVIQIIPGIPYYYHQFGYEYAIGSRSSRSIDDLTTKLPDLMSKDALLPASLAAEPFTLRVPTLEDIPYLCKLSTREAQKAQAQVGLDYGEPFWRYIIHGIFEIQESIYDTTRVTRIIVDAKSGKDCGLVMGEGAPKTELMMFTLEEGYHYREALYPVLRQFVLEGEELLVFALTQAAEHEENEAKEKVEDNDAMEGEQALGPATAVLTALAAAASADIPPVRPILLDLDPDHPITKLLESKSTADDQKNARLYTRIPSYANFILKVAPSLEHRLAQSPLAGITATLQFDFFRRVEGSAGRGLEVVIKDGRIISARDDFVPLTHEELMLAARTRKALAKAEGRPDNKKPTVFTIQFAPLSFTRLLVGDLSIDEMIYFYSDTTVSGGDDAKLMLATLFPKAKEQFQCDMFWW